VGRRTRRVIRLGDRLTVQVAKVDSFKKQVDFCLAVEVAAPRPPQQQQRSKHPQSSRRDSKRPPSSRGDNSRRQDSRPGKSRPPAERSQAGKSHHARPSNERPQNDKPATFQTSGSKFSTAQRPLIKASGSSRFSRRRR